MYDICEALDIFTDKINNDEQVDIKLFSLNVAPKDREEFIESAKMIKILKSNSLQSEFNEMFGIIDSFKNEYYDTAQVANFRSESSEDEDEDEIDQIFNEIFDDEE